MRFRPFSLRSFNLILFNAERYAREWISAGHMRSDDPSKRRMKRPDLPPNKKIRSETSISSESDHSNLDFSTFDEVYENVEMLNNTVKYVENILDFSGGEDTESS